MTYDEAKEYFAKMKSDKPFPMPWFNKFMTAEESYEFVLKNVGATLPIRDKVDERIVRTVKTGVPEYAKGLEKKNFISLSTDVYRWILIKRNYYRHFSSRRLSRIQRKILC